MPILAPEIELHPANLLEQANRGGVSARGWWVLYTRSRQEKQLMRRLHGQGLAFYCPMVTRRSRSPAGRLRKAQLPLFTNYVFLFGDDSDRRMALTTNCISRVIEPFDHRQVTFDLQQIQRLIATHAALTPESRLEAGQRVRVKNGAFRGFEGTVVRREGESRLLVAVNFLQQGASVLLDDCQLEPVS